LFVGVFHQYDGIVDGKPEKWGQWYKKFLNNIPFIGTNETVKILKNNAEKAFSLFFNNLLQHLEDGSIQAEEFLQSVDDIASGLDYVYRRKACLWNSYMDFEKFIGSVS